MDQPEHKNFFRTHKVLSLLPLLAVGAAVFWYTSGYRTEESAGGDLSGLNLYKASPSPRPGSDRAQEGARAVSALDIQGSPKFKRQVTGALKLIWMADRPTFLFIRDRLYTIRNEDKTGFYLDEGRPVAAISNAHAFRSMPWCAGIIAHQAFHSYARLKTGRRSAFLPPPPGSEAVLKVKANPMSVTYTTLDSMLSIERKASEFQINILKRTGASRAEVLKVEKRGRRDFTAGHDGNYSI